MALPTAWTGFTDLTPYAGEQVIVVGCGQTHNPHVIPNAHVVTHAARNIPGHLAFTIDINPGMNPHRVGDFWVADHTEDLPGDHFRLVYLENLPASVFANPGRCLVVARSAHRLLQVGGVLFVRTGMGLAAPGTPVHAALVHIFGAGNVTAGVDQWGMITDLRAVR